MITASDMLSARDFMRQNLVTLSGQTKIIDGVAKLLRHNISGAPVVDEDGHFKGVLSEKCCMNALTEAVEVADDQGVHIERAREFMTAQLVTLKPQEDVFDAIDHILSKRISGAPVLDDHGKFLGVFSEKTAMQVLVSAAYDYLPGSSVGTYMNTDRNRIIGEDNSLLDVAHRFQLTPYRRLPVFSGDRMVGQVSRRDVLKSEHRLSKDLRTLAERTGNTGMQRIAAVEVADYMDCEAKSISPSADLLAVAQIFLTSPYRRLPVVNSGELVGQVSRRDLLSAAAGLLKPKVAREHEESLYISTLSHTRPPSLR